MGRRPRFQTERQEVVVVVVVMVAFPQCLSFPSPFRAHTHVLPRHRRHDLTPIQFPHTRTRTHALSPTVKFSIGEVFDEEGNFWEEGLARYVRAAVDRYKRRQFDEEDKAAAGASGSGKKLRAEGKKTK